MVDKFLEFLLVEQRYSPHTLTSYKRDLQDFSFFHLQKEASVNITTAETLHIRNFIYDCAERGLSKRTINRKFSSLRSFYNFLLTINEIEVSPVENLKSLKMFPEKQIPYSREEMDEVLTAINKEDIPILEKLIIECLYQTGMRRAEMCNLKENDVDFDHFQLKFYGKGNKQRIIPVSADLMALFATYAVSRKPIAEEEKYFFINKNGKHINEKFVYRVVNKYMNLVTSKVKKNPHTLRHTFATHLLENGAQISELKELMGHASIASTQVYTHANIEQLKKVFNDAHPRAIRKDEE